MAARLRPFVERRVHRDDVDDVLQEVLERVHAGVGSVEDETHYVAWLHSVARNAVADHHRRRGRAGAKHEAFAAAWRSPEEERLDAEATLAFFVRAFVDMVPTPYREALLRTELEGFTMRQAAEREGVSPTAMKSRVRRGRRLLRELFEACCEIALDARGRVIDYEPRVRPRGLRAFGRSTRRCLRRQSATPAPRACRPRAARGRKFWRRPRPTRSTSSSRASAARGERPSLT